jgi:ribonuclease HI
MDNVLLKELSKECDILIICDGAGTIYSKPSGWASYIYYPDFKEMILLQGGSNFATNNYAELIPIINSLWYDMAKHPLDMRRKYVKVVSDSEITVKCANGEYQPKSNLPLWAALDKLKEMRYNVKAEWHPRCSNEFLTECDRIAKLNKGKYNE